MIARIIFFFILGVGVSNGSFAREPNTREIRSADAKKLSDKALKAYQVISAAADEGVSKQSKNLEELLKQAKILSKSTSLLDQFLGLRIQQSIDLLLINEACRSEMHKKKVNWDLEFEPENYDQAFVRKLAKENSIQAKEWFERALNTDGVLSSYALEQELTANDLSKKGLGGYLPQHIFRLLGMSREALFGEKPEVQTLPDIFFGSLLGALDDSADTRTILAIHYSNGGIPVDGNEMGKKIEAQLNEEDNKIRYTDSSERFSLSTQSLLSRHVGRSSATFKGVLCLYLLPFVDPGRVVEGTPETILTTNIHGLWYFPDEPVSEEKQPSEEE